ncbi:MAG: hypothetical protein IV107_16290 [Paucibacter sp.]|nr:hypothetical protein [Roseateles sp.]
MNQTTQPTLCASLAFVNPAFPSIRTDDAGEVVLWHGGRPRETVRAEILAIKDHLMTMDGEKLEMQVDHVFVDGMYMRRLHIPAGTLLVGKIHRKDCINAVESGDISVMTEFGSRRVQAGFIGSSRAGICKLGYAHVDTIFVNVFRTAETSIEAVEREIACESFEDLGVVESIGVTS